MSDYVERAPLLAKFKQLQGNVFGTPLMVRALEEAPAADVVPVVHGEWVMKNAPVVSYECSNCSGDLPFGTLPQYIPYCPRCGAKMKGAER